MSFSTSSRRQSLRGTLELAVILACSVPPLLASCARSSSEKSEGSASQAPPGQGAQGQAKSAANSCPVAVAGVRKDITLTKACSPYIQRGGGIDVIDGATLTIEAGVELRFRDNDWLEIGAAGEPGRLIAKGTAEEPIVFTTQSPETPTTWLGVWFHSGTLEGSVLSHAVIRRAGGDNRHSKPNLLHGCLTLTGVKPGRLEISDVQVENCVNGGVRLTNSHVSFGPLRFVDTGVGFVLDPQSAGQVPERVGYRGVTHNVIQGGVVASNARWAPQSVPYVVEGDVSVQGVSAPTLTLPAGLELRFAKSRALRVGLDEAGSVRAEGSKEAKVVLTSQVPEETWGGVQLMGKTAEETRLAFVDVSGVEGDAAIALRTEPNRVHISDATFSRNGTDVLVGCKTKPILANNRYDSPKGLKREAPCK